MTPAEISQVAHRLAQARLAGTLTDLPADRQPATLAEAYLIQDAIARELPWPVTGWKIGYTDPTRHALFGLTEPGYGRVFAPSFYRSPALVAAPPHATRVEAEYAFRLCTDLRPRATPYSVDDVRAAADEMYLALEIVRSRYTAPQNMHTYAVIADNLNAAGLVCGPSVPDWKSADLARLPVTLSLNGVSAARGSGAQVMGHPLVALAWLANALARTGHGLAAGQIVSTGTCVGAPALLPGSSVLAEFGELGSVALRYEPSPA